MPKPRKNALETLAGWLAARAYTTCELRRKMYKKDTFTGEEIENAIAQLQRYGFLSDRKYAEDAVRILKDRGFGVNRIRTRLFTKGIPREIIDEVLQEDDQREGADPLTCSLELLRHRARSLRSVADPVKRKMRALRMLAGRGFPAGVVFKAVAQWLQEEKLADVDERMEEGSWNE